MTFSNTLLVTAQILDRGGTSSRPVYSLAKGGIALLPSLAALTQWGDAFCGTDGPPMILTDPDGSAIMPAELRSSAGCVAAEDVRFIAGPGADDRTKTLLSSRQMRL